MVEIKKNLVPVNKYSIKCPYKMDPEYITVHNTANDAPAENEIAYMIRNNNAISFHFAVDDKEVVQGIPLDRNAWHAGDGANGTGNRKSIAIEICYSKSGGERYKKAEQNAIELIAQLLKERGWGVDRVKKHEDWSGKNCPHRILSEGRWNEFLKAIEKLLKGEPKDEDSKVYTVKKGDTLWGISQKYGMTVDELKKMNNLTSDLIFTGDVLKVKGPIVQPAPAPPKQQLLEIDGIWGPATTKALQRYLETLVDGVISGQYKNQITSAIPSVSFGPPFTGSQVIRAVQKKIGAKVDGFIGPETVRALQKYLGTPVDGVISKPSLMVKEMQKRLNEGKF